MTEIAKPKLTSRHVTKTKDCDGWTETRTERRWFVENAVGFDGTANGYGFTSPQAAYKVYYHFANRGQRSKRNDEARRFLRENPDVHEALRGYLSEGEMCDRAKEGQSTSLDNLLTYYRLPADLADKLTAAAALWRTLVWLVQHELDRPG